MGLTLAIHIYHETIFFFLQKALFPFGPRGGEGSRLIKGCLVGDATGAPQNLLGFRGS